jgi:hypothetical protein
VSTPLDTRGIFNDAVVDDSHLQPEQATTPHITGSEDIGKVSPAETVGLVNTRLKEDAAMVGAVIPFAPVVNTFQSLPKQPVKSSKPGAAAKRGSSSGHKNKFRKLVKNMDDSLDKGLAVGNWIKKNSREASCLSPAEVQEVIEHVSFSLEQPSVAAELAAGFENTNNLTCDHVVKAM